MFDVPTPTRPLFRGLPNDISVEIVSRMDVDQLVRLKLTCTLAEEYVAATIHTRSRALLDRDIRNYAGFMNVLAETRAVVGGIAALYILFPYHGAPPFVDIFAPDDTYDMLLEYLLFEEGFGYRRVVPGSDRMEGDEDDSQDSDSGQESDEDLMEFIPPGARLVVPARYPDGVSVMHRLTRGDIKDGAFCINLVRSTTCSPLLPITSEIHTALFNYVSPFSFCSSYTALNRLSRALLTPSRMEDYHVPPKTLRPAVAAWARNGWSLARLPIHFPGTTRCAGSRSPTCAAACRHFGDRHSTHGRIAPIRLRDLDVVRAAVSEERITVVWWRGGVTCARTCHSGAHELLPGARLCLRAIL